MYAEIDHGLRIMIINCICSMPQRIKAVLKIGTVKVLNRNKISIDKHCTRCFWSRPFAFI